MKEKTILIASTGAMTALIAIGLIGSVILTFGGLANLIPVMLDLWLPIGIIATVAAIVRMCLPTSRRITTLITSVTVTAAGAAVYAWLLLGDLR